MSVVLSDQQEELRQTVRRAVGQHYGAAQVIESAEQRADRCDAAVWKALHEIGVPLIGTPGFGGGLLDLGLAVQEAGRALLPGTLLGHALAQRLLVAAGDSASGTLAEVDGRGQRLGASWQLDPTAVAVEAHGGVRGRATALSEGPQADVLVFLASTAQGPAVASVANHSLTFVPDPGLALDVSRDWTAVELGGVSAQVHHLEPDALRRALLEAALLLSFDSLGSAEQCLDAAVGYAKERHQFGQAIGGFQAVKHLLVDAYVAVDNARSATWHAAAALDDGAADAEFSVHVAKAVTDQAHITTAATGIQVHGGMGFTREVTAHLHARRSRCNERLAGTPAEHLDAMASDISTVFDAWTDASASRNQSS